MRLEEMAIEVVVSSAAAEGGAKRSTARVAAISGSEWDRAEPPDVSEDFLLDQPCC
jgi:hypothetical protein